MVFCSSRNDMYIKFIHRQNIIGWTVAPWAYKDKNRMNDTLWHKCHGWFLITTKPKHLNLFQITIFFKFRTNFCFSKDMPYYKITLNSNSQYFAIYMFSTTRHSTTNNQWVTIYSVEAWHLLYSLLHDFRYTFCFMKSM